MNSTRNQCPLCRSNICDEIEPSKNLTIRLGDLKDQVEFLNDELDDSALARWDSAWEPESDEETIWINGEWHYIDTPTAQDWLVSRVIR
jgi:hypothetical protein